MSQYRCNRTAVAAKPGLSTASTQSGASLACPVNGFQIDQSNAEVGLLFPSQMGRCVDQHHLERRANRACEKMAATRCAVGQPENDVNVKTGLAVVADRNVSDGAQYLALLSDLDLFVSLLFEVEPSDRRSFESADGGERGCRKLSVVRESRQRGKRLFSLV